MQQGLERGKRKESGVQKRKCLAEETSVKGVRDNEACEELDVTQCLCIYWELDSVKKYGKYFQKYSGQKLTCGWLWLGKRNSVEGDSVQVAFSS